MDIFTKQDLELLTQDRRGFCVSLYLRTHTSGSEVQQDPINLSNMLAPVQTELVALGMRPPEARSFIRPARSLVSDKAFWESPGRGLALFLGDDFFRSYRLPTSFEDMIVAAERFHLKPLLTLLTEDTEYYLLVLSQRKIRLFQGNRFGLDKVILPGIPEGIKEGVSKDENEAAQQYHKRPGSGAGREPGISLRSKVRDDENISRYFPEVNEGIHRLLRDNNIPLVIAGVDYLLALYRRANTYPGLLPGEITGNLDVLRAEVLHEKTWPLAEPLFGKRRLKTLEKIQPLMGTKKMSTSATEIVHASYQGRVSTLLVSSRRHEWGIVDRAKGGAVSHVCKGEEPGCEDLYDLAAVQTVLKGGKVLMVENDLVTRGAPIAAVFWP